MPDNTIWVKLETKNLALRRELAEIIGSVAGFHMQRADDGRRADLLIFELGNDADKEFQLLHSLLGIEAIGEIFLTSKYSEPAVLLKAIRTGAKEFFCQPINEEEVRDALLSFKERKEKSKNKESCKIGQIINVIGSKGGVGTTTVAVNLAVALAEKKSVQSVALVDMNLLFGDIPLFLEIKPKFHWGEITKHFSRLDNTFLMNILSKHSSGVYVLPSPADLNGHAAATPDIMERLLGLMRGMFDLVIIDGGQASDETYLKILEMSDIVLLLSILSLPCLANTSKLLKTFHYFGYPPEERIKVVINRYLKNSDISLKDAEKGIDKKIFWTIPNDYQTTMSAINQGKALCQSAYKKAVTNNLRQLADAILLGEPVQEKKRWKSLKPNWLMNGKETGLATE